MENNVLAGLEPAKVFEFFEEIASIPHGSRNTKAISDHCAVFAQARNLEYHQDEDNNIIIIKEASKGRENDEPLILQGHLDMVCEVRPGVVKDMEKEALELFVEGELIGAKDTTLGADDGIAVAMIMAILDDDELSHPRLEAVFTVDEEIGMLGAASIDVSPLKGHTMLNIDSEAEGIFTVSCAGGVVADCSLAVSRENVNDAYKPFVIEVKGLTGGHSGIEINKGRANSNKTLAVVLKKLYETCDIRPVSIQGGLKDNAIPVSSNALVMSKADERSLTLEVEKIARPILAEYVKTDPAMNITVKRTEDVPYLPMDAKSAAYVTDIFYSLPEGIQKMSEDVDGLVQTSLNMGILKTAEDSVTMEYCVRSSVDREKEELLDELRRKCNEHGSVKLSGDYSAWQYRKDSPLRELMKKVYLEQYGEEVKIEAVHAGVECGVLAGKIKDLDCISYGPNLTEIHTYRERMSISSVARVYAMTRTIIEKF
ncbi:MAG: aminoacyl-histidine dipeptidase [Lachnospiraceae bacterium]|nr:aminoacyl-histidine dipeptidase [Lachnospiraceae bacterium]